MDNTDKFVNVSGYLATCLSFFCGLFVISDKHKKVIGWLSICGAFIIAALFTGGWYLVTRNQWPWLVSNWEGLFRITFFVGYCGLFLMYRYAINHTKMDAQAAIDRANKENEAARRERDSIKDATEQEYAEAMSLSNKAIQEAWTLAVVADHVSVGVSAVALFDSDAQTRKPMLLIEWRITSLAKVPCDIILEGGDCTIFTMPAPGELICKARTSRIDVAFDGKMAPGSISSKKTERILLTDEQSSALRTKLVGTVAATALIEFDAALRVNGVIQKISKAGIVQRLVATPPEWLKLKDKAA